MSSIANLQRGKKSLHERREKMELKHKISINIANESAPPAQVLKSGTMQIRKKLLNFLLGEQVNVLVVAPGDSVQTVEIRELKGEQK